MLLADFHPYVMPEVTGCPAPMVDQALRMMAIEFCRETKCWTELQSPVTLMDDVNEYDLDAPTGAQVLTVRDVWVGARRLTPVTLSDLPVLMPDWLVTRSSEPSHYNMAGELPMLKVYPTPEKPTQALTVRVTYTPTLSATALPDFFTSKHLDALTSGAKARLMVMPGVSWSSPELAVYYRANFDKAIVNTRIEEAHDRVPGTIRVKPRIFGF